MTGKKLIYLLWICLVSLALTVYLFYPHAFSPNSIALFISHYENNIILFYLLISILRGLFLIPSTPFVLVGTILFPTKPIMILGISMLGVMSSAMGLYYFSDSLGFSKSLNKKFPILIEKCKSKLAHPSSIFYVLGWSFFPLVPTDPICYAAGIVKMPFLNMFVGVFIGELTLNIIYVFFLSSTSSILY